MDEELARAQAHQYLATKAKTRWSDLSKVSEITAPEGQRETPTVSQDRWVLPTAGHSQKKREKEKLSAGGRA